MAPEVAGSNPVIHPNTSFLRKSPTSAGLANELLTVQDGAHRRRGLLLHVRQDVRVRIQRDLDARVTESL